MSKLVNAPLQEAIFELRWELQPDTSGRQLFDPHYPFALGKFQEALKEDFPHHISKFPPEIPTQLLNYQTAHQFWQREASWPVVQFGPGIATINETDKNYNWEETYLPNIKKILSALKKSYGEISFNMLSLRYIDVVNVAEYGFSSWQDFVENHVNFQFQNKFDHSNSLVRFNFEQSFDLNEKGLLNVVFSSGENNVKETIFIWQTAVYKERLISYEEVIPWLNDAHEVTSKLFKQICKNEFYASFK
jgi:uncharacterized protein (TIGR04255 family)